jgi:nitric oxide reductase large subunit
MSTVLLFYGRRLAFVAFVLVLGYAVSRLVHVSDNVVIDIAVCWAVFAAIFLPLALALDDVEHGIPPFGGRFSRR